MLNMGFHVIDMLAWFHVIYRPLSTKKIIIPKTVYYTIKFNKNSVEVQ